MELDLNKIGSNGFEKRGKDFPRLHDDNIDKLLGYFATLGSSTSELEGRVSNNEQDIVSLLESVGLTEADILLLQTQMPSISADLSSQIGLNASDISILQSQLLALSGQGGGGDVDTSLLEAISSNLQGQISQNTLELDSLRTDFAAISVSGGGFQGVVHVTNVTNAGNINKTYLPDTNNSVIDSFVSDTSNVTIELTGRSFNETWLPQVEVEGSGVTGWSEQSNGKFVATYSIEISGTGTLLAKHDIGTSHIIGYSVATAGPSILTAVLGSFPALTWDGGTEQTELKSGDNVLVTGTCDNTVTYVEVVDDSGSIFASGDTIVTEGVTTFALTGITSSRTGSKALKLRASNSLGTFGATFSGATATLDQNSPSVGTFSKTYPLAQGALKGSETADIGSTVTDYTDIVYSSPNGDLSIPSTTSYASTKTATRISGSYNVSSTNYRITARKATNGTDTVKNTVVFIANVSASINVTLPASRLRSGGSDGTATQNHTITATSNQRLGSFSMTEQNTYGSFTGLWAGASSNTVWTKTLQVNDSDTKGSGSFQSVSGTNLAGIETTSLNSGATYTLGGFVGRNLTLAAFANTVSSNVDAVDYSKIVITWSVKSLPNKRSLGTTATPDPNSWALTTLTPASVIILDTAATSSSSQASTITLEETV